MSGVSSLPSGSCPLGPSSPDSAISDYTSAPSPLSSGLASSPRLSVSRRRATVPPCPAPSSQCPKLQNLRVSLPKLSLPPELSTQPTKKIKLEAKEGDSSQNTAKSPLDKKPLLDSKCNLKVLPKSLKMLYNKVKHESPKQRDALLTQLKEELNHCSEDTKLELAKLESILQGKLLLDIASYKLSDMLLQDETLNSNFSVKQELDNFDEKPTAENLEIPTKLGKDLLCSNNNNIIESKLDTKPECSSRANSVDDEFKEFVKCKWQGCEKDVEVQHLLEHLMVRFDYRAIFFRLIQFYSFRIFTL